MTVGRNGALPTAVRCPRGESACGDHIVFGPSLLHRDTTGASLLHRETTGASHLPRATTGASLLHRSTTACWSLSSSSIHHCMP
ncbi:hypothetical protein F2Q68_00009402 [Brassica cretica]|uniref:Uncharacterized protein n=1 Tax=Brassica cretica TaxID=69181 RepID=A0A8S9KXV1_BRACR|nr:hypothetical protein F2Q68_00009402 [Brassica cretica]